MHPYYYCFKILLAKKANIYDENTPNNIVTQSTSFKIFAYKGAMPPNTSDANVNLDKSKKYPASFSRLTLSFSLPLCFSSCCFSQLFIMGARYKIFAYNVLFPSTLFVRVTIGSVFPLLYFLPKSAGISPHSEVSHLRMVVV